ncbi:IPT/TIG domain-containing protein, partial [Patescibacteria group bacterium]|nr:IPT/TIG domain-containing protein [Patescibacteria group bacterium]
TATWISSSLIRISSIPGGTAGGTASVTVTAGGVTSSAATFSYDTVSGSTDPNITNINPNQGSENGGTSVQLTGTNFGSTEGTVIIGGTTVSPSNVTWTDTSITFTTPAFSVTTNTSVSVSITTYGNLSSNLVSFTYLNEGTIIITDPTNPDISYLDPSSGRADMDIVVTIYGSNFGSTTGSVRFGNYGATILSWTGSQIQVRAPQLGAIPADAPYTVTVTRSDGKYDTASYLYLAPPSTGGTTTPGSGMPTGAWAGLISANGALAFLIKRRWF